MAKASATGPRSRRTAAGTDPAPGAAEPVPPTLGDSAQAGLSGAPPAAEAAAVADEALVQPLSAEPSTSEPQAEPQSAPPASDPAPAAAPVFAEPLVQPAAEPAAAVPPAAPVPAPPRRGVLGPVIGGVIAAGIGAGVALWAFPQGLNPVPGPDLGPLEARLAALESREAPDLAPLHARLDALDPAALEARLAALESAAPPVPVDLSALETRLSALESRPTAQASPDLARLDALEAALPGLAAEAVARANAEAEAALEARSRELAAAQARAEAVAALAELTRAAETGAPATAALDRIAAAADLPAGLDAFRTGIPTLAALQAAFPPAARAALAADPAPETAGTGSRVLNFLRAQTGARSLAPREGASTDAVLSRAESALGRDGLAAALAELDTLAPAAAAAFGPWRAQAQTRLAALEALSGLSARLGQN